MVNAVVVYGEHLISPPLIDISPVGARLIIKNDETPEKIGRIYIPKTSQEMFSWEGEVVAVGDGCEKVKVGDIVYYGRYAGYNFERDRNKYVFLNEEDILGIVNKPKESILCQTPKLKMVQVQKK